MSASRSVEEVARYLGAKVVGDGGILLTGVAPIEEAGPGDLTFVANPKYVSQIKRCSASAIIVSPATDTQFEPRILSDNPYLAFTKAMQLFLKVPQRPGMGIALSAQVHESAKVAESATIQNHVIVGADATIGERTIVESGVVIGEGVTVGNDCLFEANVLVSAYCRIGDQCILHAGSQIGGTIIDPEFTEAGVVEIGRDVELGANVVVEGGRSSRPTRLGDKCKVDNLVHIGRGCELGPGCIIVAQVTLGTNVKLGMGVTLAGQVTVNEGFTIGDGAVVGAKSLVDSDIPRGGKYWGIPAQPHLEERRAHALVQRIPKLERMLERYNTEERKP